MTDERRQELLSVNNTNFLSQNRELKLSLLGFAQPVKQIYDFAEEILKDSFGDDIKLPIDIDVLLKRWRVITHETPEQSIRILVKSRYSKNAFNDDGSIRDAYSEYGNHLSDYSIRYAKALALGQLLLRDKIAWHGTPAPDVPDLYCFADLDAIMYKIFAYALLLPYKPFLELKIEYEHDRSHWPVDFSGFVQYLRNKTQMPEYMVVYAYHYLELYAIADKNEKTQCNLSNT